MTDVNTMIASIGTAQQTARATSNARSFDASGFS